jgi:hypothetical protein
VSIKNVNGDKKSHVAGSETEEFFCGGPLRRSYSNRADQFNL